jgi:hypothetical protein
VAVVDKSIMAVKSKETTALLEEIDSSSSAICRKTRLHYVPVRSKIREKEQRQVPDLFASHINLTAAILCKTLLNFDPGLPGRDAASVDKWFPTFRRHMSPSYLTVQDARRIT